MSIWQQMAVNGDTAEFQSAIAELKIHINIGNQTTLIDLNNNRQFHLVHAPLSPHLAVIHLLLS